ncbi:MAG: metal-dependent hydrolase [Desulfovibrio sp.]|jgi:L-ascorbate metabolism protein UlaG (beta-lactamase superfamily)|nr:metal-dependent hydrolase [Desulfovibrio sp.]
MSQITWYGHSAFLLAANGVSVMIDPFLAGAGGVTAASLPHVDILLVTHDHGDHVGDTVAIAKRDKAMVGAVVGTAARLEKSGVPGAQMLNGIGFNIGGTMEHMGVKMTMTQAFHSSDSGVPAGYIVVMPDGLTVYHAGDTGVFEDMRLLGGLYPIDVALLPIGGVFTMDGRQAASACKLLGCKTVVPMHWGTFPVLAQSTEEFRRELAGLGTDCRCVEMGIGKAEEFLPGKRG